MASNYPPGVSGNEPEITGNFDFDPHAPFWVGDALEDDDGSFCIYWGADEDHYFDGFRDEGKAQVMADALNARYSLRNEVADKHGVCRICGDLHGEPPGVEEDV